MECNKDEAIKAKEIAARKFTEKEYQAAKKFALKSHSLYPGLEGVSQMLIMLDVYIAAADKVNGESDWYGILGINQLADEETLRKGYRKLALVLHPDKNKFLGADGAFKLVSEAWSLLSDKAKRLDYDQRNFSNGPRHHVSTQKRGSSAPFRANDFRTSNNSLTSNASQMGRTAALSSQPSNKSTFWTICHKCNTQYEYLRIYLNHTLLCPNCKDPFMAKERGPPPPATMSKSSYWSTHHHQQHQSSNDHASQIFSGLKRAPRPPSRTASDTNAFTRTRPDLPAEVPYYHNDKINLKYRKTINECGHIYERNLPCDTGNACRLSKNNFDKCNGSRELSPLEVRNILMEKARTEINKKIKESASEIRAVDKERAKQKKIVNVETNNLASLSESDGEKKGYSEKKSLPDDDLEKDTIKPMPMNVPDSDFHNFDLDRTERSFAENQVWAAYDEDDGMPRYYGIIHKVISLNPFKIRFSWLNTRSNIEFSPLDWIGSGFNKTCGDFRVGRHENYKALNSFSHKVTWTKSRGVIHIYPRKGDVWAVYRNWCPDWNESTPDEERRKYDMVEVINDYHEKQGVSVCPLVKVVGFRAVFQQHPDPNKVSKIPKEEMFRFSHQVPNYLITGQEGPNAPIGCCELDPAATPLELLDVSELNNGAKAENETIKKHIIIVEDAKVVDLL